VTTSSALADAVVSALNTENAKPGNGEFSQDFTAIRRWVPKLEPDELEDSYNVTVAPSVWNPDRPTRGKYGVEHRVQIGVQKAVDPNDNAAADLVHALALEIYGFCNAIALSGVSGIKWVRTDLPILCWPDHLRGVSQCFTSVVEVHFREMIAV
jgi:hypothetical protein